VSPVGDSSIVLGIGAEFRLAMVMLKTLMTCLVTVSLVGSLPGCGGSAPSRGASSSRVSSAGNGTPTDVPTYHNDPGRTGQNLTETVLTPGNVNSASFGLLSVLAADGVVDATPLVVSNLAISGSMRDVVYVATENDTIYAYDENSFALLAQSSLLGAGETAASTTGGCDQVSPRIGVTATPVIDRSAGPNGTLFVVAMSQDAAGNTTHRLHALDLVSLKDRMTPVVVQATYPGSGPNSANGVLTFDPRQYKERGALLLSGGQIYTSWASNCDIDAYNAWIMSYSESSLAQTQVINLTPNGIRGAMWNAGGLLADASGSIYALLGNGSFDTSGNYGNAAVRMTSTGSSLTVTDYFTPTNTLTESDGDIDFGSGSPLLLPDQTDASGITHQLMFAAGKDGNAFVLDRANLGQFNPNVNQVFQQLPGALSNGVYSAPAYFNGSVYIAAVGQPLTAFKFTTAQLSQSSQSSTSFGSPGASPAVSANGTSNAIVWATESGKDSPAVLHAYNPANLAQEYYNSRQAPNNRDSFGSGNKFITPVIANGRVLVATPSGVAVFGPF
jgi:hypothetical protein